jgi:8-oxo-dGTP pyrophosphatase MutT (NUDIX family)
VAVFRTSSGYPEVLLGLRANNPGKGQWTFPGGGAESGESLTAAAVREFREETGVRLYGRHIVKAGRLDIRSFLFEWSTLIIESTQKIFTDNCSGGKAQSVTGLDSGEFVSLRWVPVSEIVGYKLHLWVKEAVKFYLSGKMKPYNASRPIKGIGDFPARKRRDKSKKFQKEFGESLLFDMPEMVLAKASRDGIKYFRSKYQTGGKKSPAVKEIVYGI